MSTSTCISENNNEYFNDESLKNINLWYTKPVYKKY